MIQLIIFGTRGLTSTAEHGQFYCPRCSSEQQYALKQVRRFFTLYFIPVIPLDVAGRYVECQSCAGTFDTDILSYDPQAAAQEFFDDLKRIMVLMAVADGAVDQAEMDVIQNTYNRITGQSLAAGDISQEAQMAGNAGTTCSDYARRIAPSLSEEGLVILINVAFEVASAGGSISTQKNVELQKLPAALNISESDFRKVIEHISQNG